MRPASKTAEPEELPATQLCLSAHLAYQAAMCRLEEPFERLDPELKDAWLKTVGWFLGDRDRMQDRQWPGLVQEIYEKFTSLWKREQRPFQELPLREQKAWEAAFRYIVWLVDDPDSALELERPEEFWQKWAEDKAKERK